MAKRNQQSSVRSIIEAVYEAPKPVGVAGKGAGSSAGERDILGGAIKKNIRLLPDADNVFVDSKGVANIQFKTPAVDDGQRQRRANDVRRMLRTMLAKSPDLVGNDVTSNDIETGVDHDDPDFTVIAFFKKF
jgi:hypothetical protein